MSSPSALSDRCRGFGQMCWNVLWRLRSSAVFAGAVVNLDRTPFDLSCQLRAWCRISTDPSIRAWVYKESVVRVSLSLVVVEVPSHIGWQVLQHIRGVSESRRGLNRGKSDSYV